MVSAAFLKLEIDRNVLVWCLSLMMCLDPRHNEVGFAGSEALWKIVRVLSGEIVDEFRRDILECFIYRYPATDSGIIQPPTMVLMIQQGHMTSQTCTFPPSNFAEIL